MNVLRRATAALVLAPLAALGSISFGYTLVTPACDHSHPWLLHTAIAVCFVAAAGALLAAVQSMRQSVRGFLPFVAAGNAAFFVAVIAAQWIATPFLSPCIS